MVGSWLIDFRATTRPCRIIPIKVFNYLPVLPLRTSRPLDFPMCFYFVIRRPLFLEFEMTTWTVMFEMLTKFPLLQCQTTVLPLHLWNDWVTPRSNFALREMRAEFLRKNWKVFCRQYDVESFCRREKKKTRFSNFSARALQQQRKLLLNRKHYSRGVPWKISIDEKKIYKEKVGSAFDCNRAPSFLL